MNAAKWVSIAGIVVAGVLLASCDSDPQAPQVSSSVSGAVVFAATGEPASGVEVTMEQCADGGSMMGGGMMHDDWEHSRHATTDHNGEFHFEYMHDHEHRYRLRADGMNPEGMCYLEGGVEENIELRIESQ